MSCRKMVKQIFKIIRGWYYKTFDVNRELATKRIAICNKCSKKTHVDMLGDICGECGCVLDAKARVEDERCELNKWYKL